MMFKNGDEFNDFCSLCAGIRQLSHDERRKQLDNITAENINEPYSIALLAICVTLPNRLSKGLTDKFNEIYNAMPKAEKAS